MHQADAAPSALTAGAVVFDRAGARLSPRPRWVIWRPLENGRAEAFPLIPCPTPRDRGDVVVGVDHLPYMELALISPPWTIRTGERRLIVPTLRRGACPPDLWRDVCRAVRQSGEAAADERRAR